tara:strand:+ start:6777 stop:7250 length:474 start_codon:yes stop_codon:yes gene_type:complete
MYKNENFKPDYTPVEMIELGIFGGAYFNEPKVFEKTCYDWTFFVPTEFLKEIDLKLIYPRKLYAQYNKEYNKYKTDCGSDFDFWTEKGWICDLDPYGWFNWYINYHYGRRCFDDERQIKRWLNFKVRHGGTLRKYPNSIKTKQNLLHWAINYEKLNK